MKGDSESTNSHNTRFDNELEINETIDKAEHYLVGNEFNKVRIKIIVLFCLGFLPIIFAWVTKTIWLSYIISINVLILLILITKNLNLFEILKNYLIHRFSHTDKLLAKTPQFNKTNVDLERIKKFKALLELLKDSPSHQNMRKELNKIEYYLNILEKEEHRAKQKNEEVDRIMNLIILKFKMQNIDISYIIKPKP